MDLPRTSSYVTLLTKITAAQNEVALSYRKVRGLYFLAVAFAGTIVCIDIEARTKDERAVYKPSCFIGG